MTTLGKILVLVNVGLSMLVTAIAFGVYMHPLEVKDPEYVFLRVSSQRDAADKEDMKNSIVAEERLKLQEATSRFNAADSQAGSRWRRARENLLRVEHERPLRQAWCAEQLKLLETGTDPKGNPAGPVAVAFDKKNTQIIMDRKGRPALQRRNLFNQQQQDLKSVNAYHQEHEQLDKQIKEQLKAIDGLINEEKTLTDRLNGEDKKSKGLRQLLAEVQAAIRNSEAEQESLNRLLYDPRGGDRLMTTLAEEELLRKRNRMLKARLEELKKQGVASGPQP